VRNTACPDLDVAAVGEAPHQRPLLSRLSPWGVIVCGVLFASAAVTSKTLPDSLGRLTVVDLRLLIGGLVLLGVLRPRRLASALRIAPRRRLALAAIAMVGYQLAFFAAVTRTGAGPTMAVAGSATPLVAGLAATTRRRRPPELRWVLATAVAIAGVMVTLTERGGHVTAAGLGLAAIAGSGYGVFSMIFPTIGRVTGALEASTLVLLASGLLALPALTGLAGTSLQVHNVLAIAWLGVVASGGAYWLLALCMQTVPAERAASLLLVQPMSAVLLSMLILNIHPDTAILAGTALLTLSAFVANAHIAQPRAARQLIGHRR
jgi:drug/metabolite transporter, DME family